jgi:tetratricopeptide (TPR) repeat protein
VRINGRLYLVREQEEIQTNQGIVSRYRFGHVLFRDYFYERLSEGERRLLHGDVAVALEKLYAGQLDGMAVQLGDHFHKAGEYRRALPHFCVAAERAARIYANDEAIAHYTRAIELADRVGLDTVSLAKLHRGRGLACETLGEFDCARADLEGSLEIAHAAGERRIEWRALIDLGKLWASRDYNRTRDYFESALELARRTDDHALLAGSLNWMGNWYANAENPARATQCHQEALEIFGELGDRQDLANTLDLLGIANLLGGDLSASVQYYDQAITLYRELDDQPRLLSSLMGRGTTVSLLVLLATAPPITPRDAQRDIEEAVHIAREIHSPPEEAWAHWSLGLLYTVRGRFGRALELMQNGLDLASKIGHREWVVGNRFALGVLYTELLAPNEARRQLEQALSLAQGLRSRYWVHHVIGALAGAYTLLEDLKAAQTCLETVITSATPMDTMGKRYCWAKWAELALAQDSPALALDITERLITSARGRTQGCVITFLWLLKGEALAAMERVDEAGRFLQAGLENAKALGEQFLLWRLHASLGRLYWMTNDRIGAQNEVSAARELIYELAATVPEQGLKDSFLQGAHNVIDLH